MARQEAVAIEQRVVFCVGLDVARPVSLGIRVRLGRPHRPHQHLGALGAEHVILALLPSRNLPSPAVRFPPDVIVLAVRWYLRFGLSYRGVEELLAERGIEVDHVSVYRWVQRFTPLLAEAARPCRHAVGDRWWAGRRDLYQGGRAVALRVPRIDQSGQVIDVPVSTHRDDKAARRFSRQAIGTTKATPVEVVTDRAPVYRRCWRDYWRRPGIALTRTPTTGSRPTMAE